MILINSVLLLFEYLACFPLIFQVSLQLTSVRQKKGELAWPPTLLMCFEYEMLVMLPRFCMDEENVKRNKWAVIIL